MKGYEIWKLQAPLFSSSDSVEAEVLAYTENKKKLAVIPMLPPQLDMIFKGEDKEWILKQSEISTDAHNLVMEAHEKAIEYLEAIVQDFGDIEYRKMTMARLNYEIGIARALGDKVVPNVYMDMAAGGRHGILNKRSLTEHESILFSSVYLAKVMQYVIDGAIKHREELEDEAEQGR